MMQKLKVFLALIRAILDLFAVDDKDPPPPDGSPPDLQLPPIIPPVLPVPPVPGDTGVDDIRKELLALHNKLRADVGADPLWSLGELADLAQRQANYQASIEGWRNLHGRPPGRSFNGDLKLLSYDFSSAGENAAAGQSNAFDVVASWKGSSGHYKNITNRRFVYVGFGYARSSRGTNYWVAIFVG